MRAQAGRIPGAAVIGRTSHCRKRSGLQIWKQASVTPDPVYIATSRHVRARSCCSASKKADGRFDRRGVAVRPAAATSATVRDLRALQGGVRSYVRPARFAALTRVTKRSPRKPGRSDLRRSGSPGDEPSVPGKTPRNSPSDFTSEALVLMCPAAADRASVRVNRRGTRVPVPVSAATLDAASA